MVERVLSKRRRIMTSFKINELSAVDNPAQKHALAVLMKRDDNADLDKGHGDYPQAASIMQAVEAMDFDAILAQSKARELEHEVSEDLRTKWSAMQQSFETICRDNSLSPGKKIRAMQGSLRQLIDSLSEQSAEIGKAFTKSITAVPALAELLKQNGSEGDDPMTEAEKRQLEELQKSVTELTSKLEAATAKEPAKKAAELAGELEKAQATLAEITAKLEKADVEKAEVAILAKMSDAEKAHMAGLEGADKMKFMQMSPEDKKKAMAKLAEADPVVYKSDSTGEEFRKSDDPRLVKMAKQADESEKLAKAEREKRETAELAKRADDELKYISDDVAKREDKIEVLRAIEKMDDGPKAALYKMLSVGGKAISAAFNRIGHSNEGVAKSARDFEKRVTEIMSRDKINKLEALDKAAREFPQEFEAYQSTGTQIN